METGVAVYHFGGGIVFHLLLTLDSAKTRAATEAAVIGEIKIPDGLW